MLNRDFSQIVPRSIGDEFGTPQPFLTAGNNIDNLIEFSRGGRVNPANLLRSSLLRIAYQFDDEKLVRLQWPQMDRAQETEAKTTVLLDNLDEVTIRFLDLNSVARRFLTSPNKRLAVRSRNTKCSEAWWWVAIYLYTSCQGKAVDRNRATLNLL